MSSVLNIEIEEDRRRAEEIARSKPRFGLFSREFARLHGLHLLGTSSAWFLVDVVFYSQNLYQKDKFTKLGWLPDLKSMNVIEEVYRIAKYQLIVAACSTVPGYYLTIAFVDHMSRKRIQLMGFFFMALFTIAFAISCHSSQKQLKIVLYCFIFFFFKFRPKCYHIHCAGGNLPGEASFYIPRHPRSSRQSRSRNRNHRFSLRS